MQLYLLIAMFKYSCIYHWRCSNAAAFINDVVLLAAVFTNNDVLNAAVFTNNDVLNAAVLLMKLF